jgi:hypothetical protein
MSLEHPLGRRLAAVSIALALAVSGCAPAPADAVSRIEADFPVIEALRVSWYFRPDDGICEYFDYSGGKFSSEPAGGHCAVGLDRTGYRPFDDKARRDVETMQNLFGLAGARLADLHVEFGAEGHVAKGSFSLAGDWLTHYSYEPGHAPSPNYPGSSWCLEEIDADWSMGYPC